MVILNRQRQPYGMVLSLIARRTGRELFVTTFNAGSSDLYEKYSTYTNHKRLLAIIISQHYIH